MTTSTIARSAFAAAFLLIPLAASVAVAAAPANDGRAAYLEGLDLLERGQYAESARALSQAVEADEEKVDYLIARAAAATLAEDFAPAERDLARALRLDQGNKHARMWLASIHGMKGDFMQSSATYPYATRDPYENLVRSMSHEYGALAFASRRPEDREYLDGPRKQRAAAVAKFGEIGRAVAQRVKGASGDLAPLLVERATKLMADKKWGEALADLRRAGDARPADATVLHHRAFCNLNVGAPGRAREQFTRVLTAHPGWASSWAGRATAAAVLGDHRRAGIDLERACLLNPAEAARFKAMVEGAIKVNPASGGAKGDLAGLLDALYQQAAAGAAADELAKQAMGVIRAANAHRLRADETYLSARMKLEDAVRAAPRVPGPLADLGEFLHREALAVRTEKVEPRAVAFTYRPQDARSQQNEVAQAEQALDAALQADPRHVKALTFKAACLAWRGQWGDAEGLLRTALEVDATYGPLLQTFAQVLSHAAGVKSAAAGNLRSTKSWEDAYYYYYRSPSQAELALADQYARQAQALWALAQKHLEAAAKLHAGTADGFYYEGVIAKNRGDTAAAIAAFEQCVKLQPDRAAAWDELATFYYRAGRQRDAIGAKSAAANVAHTTAGHFLFYAWGHIARTAYKTARETLTAAMAVDPADPRVCAFLGVIAAANDKPAEALAWYRCAGALHEARALLDGTSVRSPSPETLTAEAAAFPWAVNNRLAQLALTLNRPQDALAAAMANIGVEERVPKDDRFTPLPGSMLPDVDDGQTIPVPEADAAISLIAWSHVYAGQAQAALGRQDEANRHFAHVADLPKQRAPTVKPINRLGDPWATARIAMLRQFIAKRDYEGAFRLGTSGESPGGISRPLQDELRKLSNEAMSRRSDARRDEADRDTVQQMQQLRERARQEEEQRLREADERRRTRPPTPRRPPPR